MDAGSGGARIATIAGKREGGRGKGLVGCELEYQAACIATAALYVRRRDRGGGGTLPYVHGGTRGWLLPSAQCHSFIFLLSSPKGQRKGSRERKRGFKGKQDKKKLGRLCGEREGKGKKKRKGRGTSFQIPFRQALYQSGGGGQRKGRRRKGKKCPKYGIHNKTRIRQTIKEFIRLLPICRDAFVTPNVGEFQMVPSVSILLLPLRPLSLWDSGGKRREREESRLGHNRLCHPLSFFLSTTVPSSFPSFHRSH